MAAACTMCSLSMLVVVLPILTAGLTINSQALEGPPASQRIAASGDSESIFQDLLKNLHDAVPLQGQPPVLPPRQDQWLQMYNTGAQVYNTGAQMPQQAAPMFLGQLQGSQQMPSQNLLAQPGYQGYGIAAPSAASAFAQMLQQPAPMVTSQLQAVQQMPDLNVQTPSAAVSEEKTPEVIELQQELANVTAKNQQLQAELVKAYDEGREKTRELHAAQEKNVEAEKIDKLSKLAEARATKSERQAMSLMQSVQSAQEKVKRTENLIRSLLPSLEANIARLPQQRYAAI